LSRKLPENPLPALFWKLPLLGVSSDKVKCRTLKQLSSDISIAIHAQRRLDKSYGTDEAGSEICLEFIPSLLAAYDNLIDNPRNKIGFTTTWLTKKYLNRKNLLAISGHVVLDIEIAWFVVDCLFLVSP